MTMWAMPESAKPPRGSQTARVGVRELRQNLSVYLDRVKAGEDLEVTERGVPVAMLSPLEGKLSALEKLIRAGRATRPTGSVRDLPPPLDLELERPLGDILDDLREDKI